MNGQHDFEHLVADSVRSIGPLAPSDGAHELTSSRVRQSRQGPEWLALIKEPPMRTNSRLTVGSPTVRVVAIMAATMLLLIAVAAAGAAGSRLLAAGPIVVAQDGSGDFETIAEAVDAAQDGDTIQVRPGTYVESIEIARDITLRGEGDRDQVVIRHGTEADSITRADTVNLPGWDDRAMPYSVMLRDADAVLENLTISTPSGVAVAVLGGSPRLERLSLVGDVEPRDFEPVHGLYIDQGSLATINGIEHVGWLTIDGGSAPTIEMSDLEDTCTQAWGVGTAPVLRANQMSACVNAGWALDIGEGATPLIEGNTIGAGGADVYGEGVAPIFRDNVFRETGERGIDVGPDATATIEDNEFVDIEGHGVSLIGDGVTLRGNTFSGTGLAVVLSGAGSVVQDNRVEGGTEGLRIGGQAHTLESNTVEGAAERGIIVLSPDSTLMHNRSCGNGTNIDLTGTPELVIDPSNDICEDTAD